MAASTNIKGMFLQVGVIPKINTGISCSTEKAFVFGKARVAPMKALTAPKLEPQVAVLAARLRNEVQHALTPQIEKAFMGNVRITVLQRLHSLEKPLVFVANSWCRRDSRTDNFR